MKQTAVEFLVEHLIEYGFDLSHHKLEINKAKEIEKQQKGYSEEDMRESFKGGSKMSWTDINQETQEPYYYDFNEWFEQFKKK